MLKQARIAKPTNPGLGRDPALAGRATSPPWLWVVAVTVLLMVLFIASQCHRRTAEARAVRSHGASASGKLESRTMHRRAVRLDAMRGDWPHDERAATAEVDKAPPSEQITTTPAAPAQVTMHGASRSAATRRGRSEQAVNSIRNEEAQSGGDDAADEELLIEKLILEAEAAEDEPRSVSGAADRPSDREPDAAVPNPLPEMFGFGTSRTFAPEGDPNDLSEDSTAPAPSPEDDCPDDPHKTAPGACGCGVTDTDSDGDGSPDCIDLCPNDPDKLAPGVCSCDVSDADTDGDGIVDCLDGCPLDPLKIAPGSCGCGIADIDTDGDGTADCLDGCPLDPLKIVPGVCGCGVPDLDSDGNGVPDCIDGCPGTPNIDSDGDGALDCADGCPLDPFKIVPGQCGCGIPDDDSDGDGTADCVDGCPLDPLKIAPGSCGCGVPDTDTDGDGTADCLDLCPLDPLKIAPGVCGCGVPDDDTDGDGTLDCLDGCPADPLKSDPGACGCGVPDTDTDTDGVADCIDNCPAHVNPLQEDCDGDGAGDICEIAGGEPDIDVDGVPDACEVDPPRVLLSFLTTTTLPGPLTAENEDIVAFEPISGTWEMFFDGSDVGVAAGTIQGLSVIGSGPTLELLLSFADPIVIATMTGGPGGSTTLDDSDIVRFTPSTLGNTTAGAFTFHFDGSDVGLTGAAEDIDALAVTSAGDLVISTSGSASGTGLSWVDEDLAVFTDITLGAATTGSFTMLFDGSDVGLSTGGTEDIDGAEIRSDGHILLSTLGVFAVTGAAGDNEDVFRFAPTSLGATTAGAYTMLYDFSALGIDPSEDVTGIALLTVTPPLTAVAAAPLIAGACPGDPNCDGLVNVADLEILLSDWGGCPASEPCRADLSKDGTVDSDDLTIVLLNWGPRPA